MELTNLSLQSVLESALGIDVAAARADVQARRKRHPNQTNRELARQVFSNSGWKAVASGVVTGLPSTFATAIPAALIDLATTLRIEVSAAARVAEIYDPHFLDDEEALWALFVPIMGLDLASQVLREAFVLGGMQTTRLAIRKFLSKDVLALLKRLVLKYFGVKIAQKGIITKTIPVIGGAIGGLWNFFEVRAIGKRTIAFFESMDKPLPESKEGPEMADIVDVVATPVEPA